MTADGSHEDIIRAVTDAVLLRLRGSPPVPFGDGLGYSPAPAGTPGVVWLVAPGSAEPGAGAELEPVLAHQGQQVRRPAPDETSAAGVGDVVVICDLGFEAAQALLALRDGTGWVRLVLRALLDGLPVLCLRDDLEPRPGAAQGPVAAEARRLLRAIDALGVELVLRKDLPVAIARLAQGRSTLTRAAGTLISEADVEALCRSGERRLVLARGAIVTPLARSRALTLGVEIVRQED